MEKERLKIFSERLTKLRQKKELTQQQLSEALQIPRVSITRYETAERTPTVDHLVQFAQFFNVPSDYLLGLSSVESYDIELQAICDYTGLNEEAVKALNNTFKNADPTLELSETASFFINSRVFYRIVLFLIGIKTNSNLWFQTILDDYEREKEDCIYSKKAENYSKECDHYKFMINQSLDRMAFTCDMRYNHKLNKNIIFDDIEAFNVLKSKLVNMEMSGNGKHNPTKE